MTAKKREKLDKNMIIERSTCCSGFTSVPSHLYSYNYCYRGNNLYNNCCVITFMNCLFCSLRDHYFSDFTLNNLVVLMFQDCNDQIK